VRAAKDVEDAVNYVRVRKPPFLEDVLFWFDFTDTSVLFTDTAATTNVTASGQTINAITNKGSYGGTWISVETGPTWQSSITDNGQPGADFNGTTDYLTKTIADAPLGGTQDYAYAWLGHCDQLAPLDYAWSFNNQEIAVRHWNDQIPDLLVNATLQPVNTIGAGTEFGAWAKENGDSTQAGKVSTDAAEVAGALAAGGPPAGSEFRIGEFSSGGNGWDGMQAEIVIWGRTLTTPETDQVEAWLTRKYGTTWL
jgi:hypothetical protein